MYSAVIKTAESDENVSKTSKQGHLSLSKSFEETVFLYYISVIPLIACPQPFPHSLQGVSTVNKTRGLGMAYGTS